MPLSTDTNNGRTEFEKVYKITSDNPVLHDYVISRWILKNTAGSCFF